MTPIHHSAAQGFGTNAAKYAKGRPDYPSEVESWLQNALGLGAGKTALDLGAGTGKFTSRLVATGARVIAVEPVPAMAEQLARILPLVEVKSGSAEHIPLPDASVDAVVCAQSFHWFANAEALGEIRRVLKPRGALGLIWNVRDETVGWVAALTRIMAPFEGDVPRYRTQKWRSLFPAPGFAPLDEQHFAHGHTGPPGEVIIDRVLSVSFIAALAPSEQERVAAQARALIAATPELAGQSAVTFPYETAAFSCLKI